MTRRTHRRRAAAVSAAGVLAGCAVAAPPPSPDPIAGGARLEGALAPDASPPQTAFCVSQAVPLSYVVLTSDGAAVRPAPGTIAAGEPDYAVTLRRSRAGATWVRQVGDAAPPSRVAVTAYRLDSALARCISGPVGGFA
jgi:hypothetical protein